MRNPPLTQQAWASAYRRAGWRVLIGTTLLIVAIMLHYAAYQDGPVAMVLSVVIAVCMIVVMQASGLRDWLRGYAAVHHADRVAARAETVAMRASAVNPWRDREDEDA